MRKVIGRSAGPEGNADDSCDGNHVINALLCDVEFTDRQVKNCSTNAISEKVLHRACLDGIFMSIPKVIGDCS